MLVKSRLYISMLDHTLITMLEGYQLVGGPESRGRPADDGKEVGYRFSRQDKRLVELEYSEGHTEEDIVALDKEQVPDPEQSLQQVSISRGRGSGAVLTSTGRQSVNSDKNHPNVKLARSIPNSTSFSCIFGA